MMWLHTLCKPHAQKPQQKPQHFLLGQTKVRIGCSEN